MSSIIEEPEILVAKLRELSDKWHELDKRISRHYETGGGYTERLENMSIELDDIRFEIMELVLGL
jgi:hypothetical protein